jgi:hypothetical protein
MNYLLKSFRRGYASPDVIPRVEFVRPEESALQARLGKCRLSLRSE